MKTILLFGTFDGIHEGHRSCFSQAKRLGDHLVIAVAPDAIVAQLKGHHPRSNLNHRVEALKQETLVDEVVVGDRELDSYEVLCTVNPAIVALGYDQHALAESLRVFARKHLPELEIVRLEPFQPETYTSSKL